jgi:hypothetical protein
MKRLICCLIIIPILSFTCFAGTRVRLTGVVCSEFMDVPGSTEKDAVFFNPEQSYWGFGWEVICGHYGLGGSYCTDFERDAGRQWNVEWYSEVIYMSYHFFQTGWIVDPFVHVGLGNAGSVFLSDDDNNIRDRLLLTIFPVLGAGITCERDGFCAGLSINYTPLMSPVPVTDFDVYPIKNVQAVIFCGVAIGENQDRETSL